MAIGEQMRAAGDQMKAAGSQAAQSSQAINVKVLDHAEQNVREAFNALRAAAQAGSVTDVMKVQGDYVREQSARSMEQAKEIGELIAGFGRTAMQGFPGMARTPGSGGDGDGGQQSG